MNFYKRLTFFATLLALIVVSFGAYTRLTDSGLGCPDWPGCYGTLSVPESIDQIEKAQAVYPDSPVEIEKAWIEMIHRYIAGILGIMILVIAFMSIRLREQINYSLKWPFFFTWISNFSGCPWHVDGDLTPKTCCCYITFTWRYDSLGYLNFSDASKLRNA